MKTNASQNCPQCGAPVAANAPVGLCPRCLLALNLKTETVFTAAAAQPATPLPPEEIAPHFPQLEILECLGRGGMGVVYRARQKTLNRLVALKLLAPERVGDPKFADRFAREAQALAALNHPNIVTVYDFGQAAGFYFLLMEFVDGVNLRQLLRTRKFTPEEALAIVPPLCEALQFAHDRGIVHRDIKPENLLLDKNGRAKIADFGIAKILGSRDGGGAPGGAAPDRLTQSTVGTPGYSAPEQKTDPQSVDNRADIYSLGVVIYEMLTGELPGKPLEPPSKKVQMDVRIDEIVLRALEKEPELRFQTAAQMRTEVETMMGNTAALAASSGAPAAGKSWQSPPMGWGHFIGYLGGITFTSRVAFQLANVSALGFLGALAFLGFVPLPGMRWCFGFAGFTGFFGLIGIAHLVEYAARRKEKRALAGAAMVVLGLMALFLAGAVLFLIFFPQTVRRLATGPNPTAAGPARNASPGQAVLDGQYRTIAVTRGELTQVIGASGTLAPRTDDPSRWRISAAVSEADIVLVEAGQDVEFTLDAFPYRRFRGRVLAVGNEPITQANVVAYNTTIEVTNPEPKFRPGMTASLRFITAHRAAALKIPMVALRFRPAGSSLGESRNVDAQGRVMRTVYMLHGDNPAKIEPVQIQTGIGDGSQIEVIDGLKEGDRIVVGVAPPEPKAKTIEAATPVEPPNPSPLQAESSARFGEGLQSPVTLRQKLVDADTNSNLLTVEFNRARLRDVIDFLAKSLKWNVALDPQLELDRGGPEGRPLLQSEVSLRWEKVTVENALAALLNNYGLRVNFDPQTGIRRITKIKSNQAGNLGRSGNDASRGEPGDAPALAPAKADSPWPSRLQELNQGDWRQAFALGQELAQRPPDEGLDVLRMNWSSITNVDARQQFLKAFTFAKHPHLLVVLELGLLDPAPPVQTWALSYLRDIALRDFAEDYAAAKSWLASHRDQPMAEVLAASAREAATRLREGDSASVLGQLTILRTPVLFRDQATAIEDSGMGASLESLINGRNQRLVEEALRAATGLPLGESWYRRVILPKIQPDQPVEVRAYAANTLQFRGGPWAVEPLVSALTNLLTASRSEQRSLIFQFAGALGEIGSATVIPTLIGLIEADNTYDTVYGIGYFGLSKLTGVSYDQKHDGAWWRQWWETNKQRYPAEVQALEIPRLEPAKKGGRGERTTPDPAVADVAGVPAEKHFAGGDTNKLYFLIGRTNHAAAANAGHRLLLVLPGGDGGPDFQPFVKRICQNALPDGYLVAQLIAPKWDARQFEQIVWPTEKNRYPAMKFSTEVFVNSVVADIENRHRLDTNHIFTLAWSSGGPAAYAVSLDPQTRMTGSFIAMSVFNSGQLPALAAARGRAYYLLHSPTDFIPMSMPEQAREALDTNGAKVRLQTYAGGHGWHGNVFGNIRAGVQWLEKSTGTD